MAAIKVFCPFFLVLFAIVFVGFAQQQPPPCVNKLMPCQPYLKSPANPPPACCLPLGELVTSEKECMCQIFDNPALLKSFNITQDDALQLTKACHAKADVSICKNETASPTGSPVNPTTPSAPNGGSAASPAKSGAVGVGGYVGVGVGGSAVLAAVVFLVFSNMGF